MHHPQRGNRADGLSKQQQDELAAENLALAADVPDRGAPGTGELDYEALFGQLARQGYAGWIGCEYKPSDPADSSTSFGWREPDGV